MCEQRTNHRFRGQIQLCSSTCRELTRPTRLLGHHRETTQKRIAYQSQFLYILVVECEGPECCRCSHYTRVRRANCRYRSSHSVEDQPISRNKSLRFLGPLWARAIPWRQRGSKCAWRNVTNIPSAIYHLGTKTCLSAPPNFPALRNRARLPISTPSTRKIDLHCRKVPARAGRDPNPRQRRAVTRMMLFHGSTTGPACARGLSLQLMSGQSRAGERLSGDGKDVSKR